MSENNGLLEFIVTEESVPAGEFLRQCGVSHRLITLQKRIPDGITLNGKKLRTVDLVHAGDVIRLKLESGAPLQANPALSVPLVYEDGSMAVFDKPSDMPVHPSIRHREDTLGNYFASVYPDLTFRPINRLDKDTSGLCAVAKNPHSAALLQNAVKKVYYAAVSGEIIGSGRISAPIGRAENSIIRRQVCDNGQTAVTDYTAIGFSQGYTLLKIILQTGRTHQIRVHFSHIGHPLAGDDFYGGSRELIGRQALHCGELSFTSPDTGAEITLNSPLPKDIAAIFE